MKVSVLSGVPGTEQQEEGEEEEMKEVRRREARGGSNRV